MWRPSGDKTLKDSGVVFVGNLKTGLIGAGVFGGYHAGKIAASRRAEFVGVFDPDADRCAQLAAKHGVQAVSSQSELLSSVDAVIVACPATYHEAVVSEALAHGCHVMVEKPLALTGASAMELASRADAAGLILQVGHQERFVLEAMCLFDIPEIPTSISAVRAGPPAPDGRAGDVSVIWDLMIHDLDMAAKLLGSEADVRSEGRIVHSGLIDEATVRLTYDNAQAEVTASRAADARDRRMKLTYPSGEIDIDFLTRTVQNSTPFEIKADVSETLPDPLGAADEAFFEACLGERECAVPGREAAIAVVFAEQAEQTTFQPAGA